MEAEELVNAADSSQLHTCSLRPADIYGPGDPYHMPPLLEMVRKGLFVRIGNGSAVSQHVYVGNIALAHIQAAAAFLDGNLHHAGRSYFIADGEAANFFAFFGHIIETAGYTIRPKNFRIPFLPFYLLGALVELVTLPVRAVLKRAPRVSRFAAIYTCTTYTFDSRRATEDFGYAPRYTEAEGVAETAAYYRNPELLILDDVAR
jgi:nucleoside-diphosphate-sugar epimerase